MLNERQKIPLAVLDNEMMTLTKMAKATLLMNFARFCSNGGEECFDNLEGT